MPRAQRRGKSLGTRVMLLVSVGMIATLAATGIIGWLTFRRLEAQLVAQHATMARVIAWHLDDQFQHMLAGLLGVGLEAREAMSLHGPPVEAELLRRLYLTSNQFDALLLVDRSRQVRVAMPEDAARYAPDFAALQLPLVSTSRPMVAARPTGNPFKHQVWSIVPITGVSGDQVGWAAGMTLTQGRRFAAIASPLVSGSLGTMDLLDRSGNPIAVSAPADLHPASHGPGVHRATADLATVSWQVVVHDDAREPNAERLLREWLLVVPASLASPWSSRGARARACGAPAHADGRRRTHRGRRPVAARPAVACR